MSAMITEEGVEQIFASRIALAPQLLAFENDLIDFLFSIAHSELNGGIYHEKPIHHYPAYHTCSCSM